MITAADRPLVALQLPADEYFLPAVEAAWDAGEAVLPLPVGLPEPALRRLLEALRPQRLRREDGDQPLPEGLGVAASTAAVIATSGSTGEPKGVELSRAALTASVQASLDRIDGTAHDRWLCCLPVTSVGGLAVLLRARLSGAAVLVLPRFDVSAVAAAAAQPGASRVSLVPTMLARLLDAGIDLRRFRSVLLGGARPGAPLLARARAAGVALVTTYGMTETCGGCVYDGEPLHGVEVALDSDGGVRLRGPMLFAGYRLREADTAAALDGGWLRTNDVGRWTADGLLEVIGRSDDAIVTGGVTVHAGDVEDLLAAHPAVREVAVAGAPDDDWGQRIVAYVVPRGQGPQLRELREWVRRQAPSYKAPRDLVVVDGLPRLGNGKVDRGALALMEGGPLG